MVIEGNSEFEDRITGRETMRRIRPHDSLGEDEENERECGQKEKIICID